MKCTEQLSRDHQTILKALEILRYAAATWCGSLSSYMFDEYRQLIDFLKTFADRCHDGKEERVLFPKLLEAGVPADECSVGVMLHEHEKLRQLMQCMEDALVNRSSCEFSLYANKYADLLEEHIAKEDNILFPRADRVLTEEADAALLNRFDEIEQEIGPHTHETLNQLLKTLLARYHSEIAKVS